MESLSFGVSSEGHFNEKNDRVTDVLNFTRAAVKEGIAVHR